MKPIKSTCCLIVLLWIPGLLWSQLFPAKNYPRGYFTWPVQATKALAANFGELRPNHYHMGLDCKTEQRENLPILAAADGYVAKVKIEPFGFGRCIYINHPNGLTTLYAHLNDFYPALEKWITDQQYKAESWSLFLENIPPDLFPVKKGQFIAYSGNTGGSQGPHLHFEIRDTRTDKVLNPLLFGFPVQDNIPPVITRLAVYDRNRSTYEQTPRLYPLKHGKGGYQTSPALITVPTDKVSFAVSAVDRYTGSTNQNGIYEAVLYENGRPVVGFQLDSISYDETRYLNAHIDFRLRTGGGPFVQHLSRLPGYPEGVYREFSGDGVLDLSDGESHRVRINVKDTEGNSSVLEFDVRSSAVPVKLIPGPGYFKPGFFNVFDNQQVQFYLAESQLYDGVEGTVTPVAAPHGGKAFRLIDGNVPVHSFYPVRIRYPDAAHPDRMVMKRWWGAKDHYDKATPIGEGWYESRFKALGNVELYEDLVPPVITPVGFHDGMHAGKLNRIVFVIRDESDELRNFRAELDGRWLRFSNDKGKTFIYKFDERCPPGAHVLRVSVEDVAGNRTEKIYRFTR